MARRTYLFLWLNSLAELRTEYVLSRLMKKVLIFLPNMLNQKIRGEKAILSGNFMNRHWVL